MTLDKDLSPEEWEKQEGTSSTFAEEQTIEYMLQKLVKIQERIDQHHIDLLQLAEPDELPPLDDEELQTYLKEMGERYGVGFETRTSNFRTVMEAQNEMIEAQNEKIKTLRAKIEALKPRPSPPKMPLLMMLLNGIGSTFMSGVRQMWQGVRVVLEYNEADTTKKKDEVSKLEE